MKIHKEGYRIIAINTVAYVLLSVLAYMFTPIWTWIPVVLISVLYISFNFRFFRVPNRPTFEENNTIVFAPADGTIVAIEEVYEDEYLKENRIQVSVFMSIWNIHINWFPVGGEVKYRKHHNGNFKVAWHPKSSTENERVTTVVDTGNDLILFRQIAGYVARRIVNYAVVDPAISFRQCEECGFIKFGSRVDLFLPLDSVINVKLNDKVVGTQTQIAHIPERRQ